RSEHHAFRRERSEHHAFRRERSEHHAFRRERSEHHAFRRERSEHHAFGREAPLLRIVTPDTTPEEIAAIVAVFSALGGSAPTPEPPRSEWADPARGLRRTGHSLTTHGRGAWRASGLPR
ncbi:acyl-CoA carboxylase subunit epsilon, partial [Nocardioides ginsengisoli]